MIRYISVATAAQMLGVTPRTVQNYIARGMLHPIRLPGGHYRLDREQVVAFRDRLASFNAN